MASMKLNREKREKMKRKGRGTPHGKGRCEASNAIMKASILPLNTSSRGIQRA
jgi:hypothetical protein